MSAIIFIIVNIIYLLLYSRVHDGSAAICEFSSSAYIALQA